MQDVIDLDRLEFSYILAIKEVEPSSSTFKPRIAKSVNFLEKFGDPKTINEMDKSGTSESIIVEKRDLRTKN
jgi:hypothetical protein